MSYGFTYPIATTFKTPLDIKDSINVTYTSPWSGANLTVLCVPDGGNVYYWYNMPDNPQKALGSYLLPSFEVMGLKIKLYPAPCVIRLTKYGTDGTNTDSPSFVLTSSAVSAKTYGPSTTLGLPSTSSTSLSSTSTTTTSTPGSPTTTANNSALTPISTPSNSSAASSQGISKGTAAGIGIGAALGALVVIGAIVLWVWCARKRKRRYADTANLPPHYNKAELYSPYDQGLLHSSAKGGHYTNISYVQAPQNPAEMQASTAQAEMLGSEPRYEVAATAAVNYDSRQFSRKPVGQRAELLG